jgi:hypothetical protein
MTSDLKVTSFQTSGLVMESLKLLDGGLALLCDVPHDAVDHLALVVPLLALNDVLGADTAFAQIDVALLLVDTQHYHNLVAAHTNELLDGTDTSAGKFGEQNHAVDVVVLQQLDVGAHLGDLLNVDHNEAIDLWKAIFVEAAVGERHVCGCLAAQGSRVKLLEVVVRRLAERWR